VKTFVDNIQVIDGEAPIELKNDLERLSIFY